MKLTGIVALFLIISSNSFGQNINTQLKKELDSMYVLDQKYRELMQIKQDPKKADSLAKVYRVNPEDLSDHLWNRQNEVDESNIARVEAIIKQYGYPGESLVGSPSNIPKK